MSETNNRFEESTEPTVFNTNRHMKTVQILEDLKSYFDNFRALKKSEVNSKNLDYVSLKTNILSKLVALKTIGETKKINSIFTINKKTVSPKEIFSGVYLDSCTLSDINNIIKNVNNAMIQK